MKGTTEEARSINSYLDLMKTKVFNAQMDLMHQNENLTIENFKVKLLRNRTTPTYASPNIPRPQQQNQRIG